MAARGHACAYTTLVGGAVEGDIQGSGRARTAAQWLGAREAGQIEVKWLSVEGKEMEWEACSTGRKVRAEW
jgi:hypothetical protein